MICWQATVRQGSNGFRGSVRLVASLARRIVLIRLLKSVTHRLEPLLWGVEPHDMLHDISIQAASLVEVRTSP